MRWALQPLPTLPAPRTKPVGTPAGSPVADMSLSIFNSLTRRVEPFEPIEPGHVRMYVCGMTVYDLCHLGHARSMLAFDVVQRWLKASGYRVTYVRNVTDIDDKIIARAVKNGETITALTDRMIDALHSDADALGIERPTHEPRATEYVPQMLDIVRRLEDKGLAYRSANGDVNYAVRKFPGYGKLSGKSLDDLRAGERVGLTGAMAPPRPGRAQLMVLAEILSRAEGADEFGKPEIAHLSGGARAAVVSDFLGDLEPVRGALAACADRGIRGVMVQVLDPQEEEFPFDGRTIFESMGGGIEFETRKAGDLRSRYLERLAERRGALAQMAQAAGWQFSTHHTGGRAQAALLWMHAALARAL